MRVIVILAALALCVGLGGAAADPDPVMTPYRAFKEARAKDDLVAAEASAAQALAASQARDGRGGSTAALAFNLALVRLDLKRPADAVAPARLAVELAEAGAKGVDPLTARLLLGEAELTADPKANEDGLAKALKAAETRPDLDDFAYSAAMALVKAAVATHRPDNIVLAWRSAATHAAGAHSETALVRGRALTEVAISLVGERRFKESHDAIDEAIFLLAPLSPEQPDDRFTVGESYLADAMAVRAALGAVDGDTNHKSKFEFTGSRSLPGAAPLCGGRITPRPYPEFPRRPLMVGEVGAVVVRFATDADAKVTSVRALSTIVNPDFRKAVENPRIKWTYTPDGKPGCRVASTDRLEVVRFLIGF
jgi:tetratricopeptide (TPR) repeat protein